MTGETGGKKKVVKKKVVVKKIIKRKAKGEEETPPVVLPVAAGRTIDGSSDSDSDSESGSEAMPASRQMVNKDVLSSFINKKSEFYEPPEVQQPTGILETVQAVIQRHRLLHAAAPQPSPALPAHKHPDEGLSASQELPPPARPKLSPFLGFSQFSDEPMGVDIDLPLDQKLPAWIPATHPLGIFAMSPSRDGILANPAVALHLEVEAFLKWSKAPSDYRKAGKAAGKAALQVVQGLVPKAKGALVGSVAARLDTRTSNIDITVWMEDGTPLPTDKIHAAFATSPEWEVESPPRPGHLTATGTGTGVDSTQTLNALHVPTGRSVQILLNDKWAANVADFLAAEQQRFKGRLNALSNVLSAYLAKRGMLGEKGGPARYVISLLASGFLRHASATGKITEGTGLGTLLVEFIAYLAFHLNPYAVAVNPADPCGRVVAKESAPRGHLEVIDPVTGRNAAWRAYNWAVVRESLEHAALVLGHPWPVVGCELHAKHPDTLLRPTLLSRLL